MIKNGRHIAPIVLLLLGLILLTACQNKEDDLSSSGFESIVTATEAGPVLNIDENHLLPEENYGEREGEISHIVLHFMSNAVNNRAKPYEFEELYSIFTEYGISAHYLIDRQGKIYRLVEEDKTAYHAGKGKLDGYPHYENRLNHHSIGIEMMAIGTQKEMGMYLKENEYRALDEDLIGFTQEQYEALNKLLQDILRRNPKIKNDREHIIGHDEYSNSGKTDPGSLFQWDKLNIG